VYVFIIQAHIHIVTHTYTHTLSLLHTHTNDTITTLFHTYTCTCTHARTYTRTHTHTQFRLMKSSATSLLSKNKVNIKRNFEIKSYIVLHWANFKIATKKLPNNIMKFRFLIWFIFLLCKTVLTQDKDGFCQIENADGQKDNLGKIYIYISVLANQTFLYLGTICWK